MRFAIRLCLVLTEVLSAQAVKKKLVLRDEKAIDSSPSLIQQRGGSTRLWNTRIRTDTEPLTKKKLGPCWKLVHLRRQLAYARKADLIAHRSVAAASVRL